MEKASHLVKEIRNKERNEELWVKGSFYAFMGSSLYIFLKRFYLKELLGYFLWALISTFGLIFQLSSSFLGSLSFFDFSSEQTKIATDMLSCYLGDVSFSM